MSDTFNKDKVGYEDLFIDSAGTDQSFSRETSGGLSHNIKGMNASLLPLLLATRSVALYNGTNLNADELDTAIVQLCASVASIHKFANQSILDSIQSAGSGAIMSSAERSKLNAISGTGSGRIITDIERNKLNDIVGLTQDQINSILNVANILPVGSVMGWATATPPTGFLECDGAAVSRATYSDLFGVLAETYGAGDGSTTFNLPDYRGKFLRGWDHGATNDPDALARTDRGDTTTGDAVGTNQLGETAAHTHGVDTYGYGGADIHSRISSNDTGGTLYADEAITNSTGGNETRPLNINIMHIIRYSL